MKDGWRMGRILFLALICAFSFAPSNVQAQGAGESRDYWAELMFNDQGTVRSHDFGSVALHAEVEHRFAFRNIYKEDVVIESARSNCGCTKVSISKQVIRSMEVGEIIARIDTSGKEHTRQRKATITVRFSKPSMGEVQMQVKTYIRADVGIDPGVVEFGTVSLGKSVTKTVYLRYEGNPSWALIAIDKSNPGFQAEAIEVERRNGHIVYKVDVTLKDSASPGYINDLLRFTTNETNSANTSVFLPIHGLVMEPLTAKPSFFQFGVLRPGEKITKNLVVRASTPFMIKDIHSDDPHMNFLVANRQSTVQVIPITYTAGSENGPFDQTITVETDKSDLAKLEITVSGNVATAVAEPLLKKSTVASKSSSATTPIKNSVSPEAKQDKSSLQVLPRGVEQSIEVQRPVSSSEASEKKESSPQRLLMEKKGFEVPLSAFREVPLTEKETFRDDQRPLKEDTVNTSNTGTIRFRKPSQKR